MKGNRTKWLAAGLAALALAGCGGGPKGVGPGAAPVVPATVSDGEGVFALLLAGNPGEATKRLRTLRRRDPGNPTLQLLADSIERDPKDLLGPQSYPYTVRTGDTIVTVAQRLLGNRLKAYQLLRYNGLTAPVILAPGQVLRIPGTPPRIEPVRPAEPAPRPNPPAVKPKPAAPRPVTPAAPAANPAAARQARAAGLAALNQGNVVRAVQLLRRARQLDPANPAIARDLARAERILATVRARR